MKTIRTSTLGQAELRLVEKDKSFIGIVVSDGAIKAEIRGDSADDVWRRLHDEADKGNPKYFGFDGARNRFLHFFAGGFGSPKYAEGERDYKLKAKAKLDAEAPLEKALMGSGLGEAVLSAFRNTNLLSPFEKTRLQDVLRGPKADAFIRGAAKFASGQLEPGLSEMEHALKPHDSAKWTVATYLPFLWRPDAHMFLKPEVTKDFALRVGHRFARDYEPRLHLPVYESLLDLVAKTEAHIGDLHPKDRIDVQSFIWVIGDYKDGQEAPQP